MKKVGIVGGGQLGRMMAMEAADLGASISVLDPTPRCPASSYAEHVEGDFTDKETVLAFGKDKDVLTFEIESANIDALIELERRGVVIHPSPRTLSIIRDKFQQKEFLSDAGIPVAPYARIESATDVSSFANLQGYPLVLKSRFGAYDGRGNRTIHNEREIARAMSELGEQLYVEAWVPFEKELAVVAGRSMGGVVETFPVVETIHTDHICDVVISPAPVSETITQSAEFLAQKILDLFKGAGVFGIEMFLTKDNKVLINEIAPRVHNSGHLTLGGASISQFRQHMLAILGRELERPTLAGKVVVMKNILGERNAPACPSGLTEAEALGARIEIYGKHDTKIRRKMGHITVQGNDYDEVLARAHEVRVRITI